MALQDKAVSLASAPETSPIASEVEVGWIPRVQQGTRFVEDGLRSIEWES
jgi:hypothetical protein